MNIEQRLAELEARVAKLEKEAAEGTTAETFAKQLQEIAAQLLALSKKFTIKN